MKDTTLNNTIFQREFNTTLQLSDIFEFLKYRFAPDELILALEPSKADLENLYHDTEHLEYFTTEELRDAVDARGDMKNPEEFIASQIETYGIAANYLFDDEAIKTDFEHLFEAPCLESVSDSDLINELEARDFTLAYPA